MDIRQLFNPDLIRRYDVAGPRYTSYPTAADFHTGISPERYAAWAQASNAAQGPLSLYFHIPFCARVCFYCACNKIITNNRSRAQPYLDRLYREIALQGALYDRGRPVEQLHWGGGTPTFLTTEQMQELMAVTGEHFQLLEGDRGEYSIEIDPREVHDDTIAALRALGFNRLSLGVQDFDPRVQKAVNRIQPESMTFGVIAEARRTGFRSVSLDLIYGLPLQSEASFAATVDKVLEVRPDRLSVFNYAHMPERFKTQRQIDAAELPSPDEKLRILQRTTEQLLAAGYVYIGMDHFARPEDELAIAQREGTLYRNFQGYSTHADCDLVAMGVTSIGKVGHHYIQNRRDIEDYYADLDAGRLPVFRGYELDEDDVLRRQVINELICHFRLDFAVIERDFSIRFGDYFATELDELAAMERDGLLALDGEGIRVHPAGRLLIRNICMVFDRYLRARQPGQTFSRVI
jgi:oxygen-independent coproporphyrinogen-3 oxidase